MTKTRNWSLFFFFRILPQAEFDATIRRIEAAARTTSDNDDDKKRNERDLWLDFAQPSFANAGVVDQRLADIPPGDASPRSPDDPAQAFLDWLKVLASADKNALLGNLTRWIAASSGSKGALAATAAEPLKIDLGNLSTWVRNLHADQRLNLQPLSRWLEFYGDPKNYAELLKEMGQGLGRLSEGGSSLAIVALYELLRQCALAMSNQSNQVKAGVIRGEAECNVNADADIPADTTPINIAFAYSGLEALKLDKVTLASFPDPFKQGMAARAQRLHDTGPSAPENWEGELGLPSIHGYFTGGFAATDKLPREESFWKALRSDVAAFNNPVDNRGDLLRFWLRLIFRALGLEILHIELGQDPYHVNDHGQMVDTDERVEHFGFRDGLSQPFIDLGLGDTAPGGGTASRNGTWTPIAPGEIFLSLLDEDNEEQRAPISRKLTVGSTFLVFRKLEQDVAGFRAFLQHHRPDREGQDALAAQMVGRWQDGTPLVLSPELPRAGHLEASLNDFRYAADDPRGAKCPLQAHIRRANPRDIGGRDDVRRHRILRRGISYGGPLLQEGTVDNEKRGLLFIAANSRIDLQFEVIQADWINRGEFLGQAGLGRCPLTGAHDGTIGDSFLEANAIAPITRMPRFVITRGGDYFFAPGIGAIRLISEGKRFEPEREEIPFGGFTMADALTSVLFDRDRLQRYSAQILAASTAAVVRVPLPPSLDGSQQHISFVGQHAHVTAVLKNDDKEGRLAFSVKQYRDTARLITRGQDMLVAVDTGPTRDRLKSILNAAWLALYRGYEQDGQKLEDVLSNIVCKALDMAIRRTAQARRIDLVHDLASRATYALLCELYGTPGPRWLTELAASLPFARQHVGELPPDWLASLVGERPDDQGFATMQVWSTLVLADLVGNIQSQAPLHVVTRQAATEMLNHIDGLLALRRLAGPVGKPKTLLEAFIKIEKDADIVRFYSSFGADASAAYYKDVSVVLLEIAGTSLAAIPLTFASVMGTLFKLRIDLASLLKVLPGGDGVARLIYEAERLNPNLAVRMRHCERTTPLPGDTTIQQGDWVGALIVAANLDGRVFPKPHLISFDPANRKIKDYLLFNESGSERECWGRDRVSMAVLRECMLSAGRLKGLRRIAGAAGEPVKLVGVAVGLPARFTHVAPKQ
ncbi:Dyp-type peroxidase [Bradyrhizobium lablabi]|uniref:Dyp-type peroxidase n=1 Tax=Bradyrhizobium lablabi TaxID=722472 RepID=UPI001BAD1B8D|nr:Dyp-type peroxidase [Bradyrhizobium lablabi]